MANTVIAVRSSGTAAATPSLGVIANGELSLNFADGIIYYKTASNTLGSIRTTQPAGLTTEIQFNDAGSFGSNTGLTFSKTTGYFKAPIIESTNNGNGTNFKVGDDIWIGDVNVADTLRLTGQQNVNNAYIIFGASDSSKLGRAGTGALTYTGNFVATGELSSLNSSGDEGGQINFGIPQTNTVLNGGVVIDVFQNLLRFYEAGGTNRGAYINLASTSAGVGTNLLTGGGAVTSVAGATGAVSNNQILAGLLTVDGAGSGLDADLLDGLSSASFANAAFANTDYTTISATAGVYGNASHIPVTTLTANGRVSSITNTAIAIDAAAITSGTLAVARGGTGVTTSTGTGAIVLNTSPTLVNVSVSSVNITNTTTSTSNTTGALTVLGGIGVKGNVSANGIIFDDGTRQTTAGASIGDVLALSIALG